MGFSLVADRFLPLARAVHLDVATGDRAWLRIEPATSGADGLLWAERCAALVTLWHPRLAECLDFGLIGTERRFEAYRVSQLVPQGQGRLWDVRRARDRVEEFLIMCGVAPGVPSVDVSEPAGGWLVVPGAYDGTVAALPHVSAASLAAVPTAAGRTRAAGPQPRPPDGSIGVRLVHRRVCDALRERLSAEPPAGMTVTDVEAAPGAGGRTLLRFCAREARRLGWVAFATPALRWFEEQRERHGPAVWDDIIRGRHVVLLHDGRSSIAAHDLAAIALRLGTQVPRPHRLIQLVRRPRAADALTLAPLVPSECDRMFVLAGDARPAERRVRSAVARCGGRPRRCVDAVLRLCAPPVGVPDAVARAHVVHDTRMAFATGSPRTPGAPFPIPIAAPEPGAEDAGVWQAIAEGARLAGAGRHAAAERLLRQSGGAQARRGCQRAAGDAALACGTLHMNRGRTRRALESFSDALSRYDAAGATAHMIVAAAWLGRAHLDALHTEESEACLRTAVSAGVLAGASTPLRWARVSFARTLWWLGRTNEAHALLLEDEWSGADARSCRVAPDPRWVALARTMLAVRVGCALGEPEGASAQVTAARENAAAIGTPAAACLAQLARAHWSAALGDMAGLDESVASGLLLAREARRPLDALRFRILRCQARASAGSRAQVAPDQRALRRALTRDLPGLLALRVRLALGACAGPAALAAVCARCRAHGLMALGESCASFPADARIPSRTAMIDDVIEVLRICQEGEDARSALLDVARLIQAKLRADAVVFVASGRRPLVVAWPAGGRLQVDAATRAIGTGAALLPQRAADGTEAAHPVRCAGVVIGAVACRWTGALLVDPARAAALLAGVAAAIAPAVRVLLDHTDAPALPGIEADLLGVSPAIEDVRRAVARAADAPYPVLVQAESGAGKELVARAIHRASARRTRPFHALNCAALPDELIEAELFGHARGAFTGAIAERRGLFEEADGGVLFLDEVGELSARGQAKLLRVIQEGEIRRVGETVARRVDVRLVAATNRLLDQEVEAGRFRRDLWYRLDVIRIAVPPLRERPEDVPVLAAGFWRRTTERVGSRAVLSDATLAALARYDWPGNVRELQNVLAALAVSSPRRGVIGPSALPATLARVAATASAGTLEQARRLFEARFVRAALARAGGHRGRAAAELGLTRQGLAKLMGRLGVESAEACASPQAERSLPEAAAGG